MEVTYSWGNDGEAGGSTAKIAIKNHKVFKRRKGQATWPLKPVPPFDMFTTDLS